MAAQYLEKAINDLPTDIVLMRGEERRLEKLVRAASNVVLGLKVLSC